MPIRSPDLDDLRYDQVRADLVRRIPVVAPEWTDHNESDPGIAMIQLFAYLAEQIGYRLNRVTEKTQIELLRLMGVQLRPAVPARTTLALVLSAPETRTASALRVAPFARAKSQVGNPAAVFEIAAGLDVVPAQIIAVVTTVGDDVRDVAGGAAVPANDDEARAFVASRSTLAWNGAAPKLELMPVKPISLFALEREAAQRHVFLALAFNPARPAGFLGQRVTLTLVLDDDEQPSSSASALCGEDETEGELPPDAAFELAYYRNARPGDSSSRGAWESIPVLSDTTQDWSRSGALRFDVPVDMGAIPDDEWLDVRAPSPRTMVEVCRTAAVAPGTPMPRPIAHPLIGALRQAVSGAPTRVPASGWLRLRLPTGRRALRVRQISFNVASAEDAIEVRGELVGLGNGLPGQRLRLANANVLPGSLELVVEDFATGRMEPHRIVTDLDGAGRADRVALLDEEAGEIVFGDGRGVAPAVDARIVALRYRYGGGERGNVPVGVVTLKERGLDPIAAVTNVAVGRGGRDGETLAAAEARMRRELAAQHRAVTKSDFELFAEQTPDVRVAQAVAVGLRRPSADPERPGLVLEEVAPGAVTVIVVPDEPGLYPTPTASALRAVCRQLDRVRLVTTEVHVAPPQYARLFDVTVDIVTQPGFSKTLLRDAIATHLATRLHVRGAASGRGVALGSTLHHADLVAEVLRVEGVVRVERLEAFVDARTPEGAVPQLEWRAERREVRRLTGCIEDESVDVDRIELAPDESVFVDTSSLLVGVLG